MIIQSDDEYRKFWEDQLAFINTVPDIRVIIVDPYCKERSNSTNVNDFISLLKQLLSAGLKTYWFYNSNKAQKKLSVCTGEYDLSGIIDIHDRFLFFFDGKTQTYLKKYHLGASINGCAISPNINTASTGVPYSPVQIQTTRLSILEGKEFTEIDKIFPALKSQYNWEV